MKFFLPVFFLLALNLSAQREIFPPGNAPIPGQDTLSPLHIVQNYVSPNGFPGKLKFFCCELYKEWYADSTLGQQLPADVQRYCKIIFQDSTHAAVSVWLYNNTTSKDYYFYLVKNKNWTIYAIRSLAMSVDAEDELKKLDSIPEKDRGKVYSKSHKNSWQFEHDNLNLWLCSDTTLADYFRVNQKQFYVLQKMMVKKGYYGKNDSLARHAMKDKKILKMNQKLLLRNIQYDKNYPGCVFYLIGGINDNTVGYMFQPDPKKIPHITEKHYIYVREIGNGWYVFKTT